MTEGQELKLSECYPEQARRFSLKNIIQYCNEIEPEDQNPEEGLKIRNQDLSHALKSLKRESMILQWFIHLSKITPKLTDQEFKELFSQYSLHGSEFNTI